MASGSTGRINSASKGFDFASDDILCSYDDFANQENSNGSHTDSAIGTNSKEFNKSRMARSSVFPSSSYSPPEESGNQDVIIAAVERSMKKYSDNLMRFLEGLSSRLSQLELYCYNLDKSIGEMRSDLARDQGEADSKLKSLEKHLQEVHRSVQILRDKQELADTQKELAKLQLANKESASANNSQQNEERSVTPDTKKHDNAADMHGQQLALALPHQVAPQPSRPAEMPQPAAQQPQMAQSQTYYLPTVQIPNLPAPAQLSQGQYLPPQSQVPQPQPQPQIQSAPQYQQQWAQLPQQVQVQQPQQVQMQQPQPSMQPQVSRPMSNQVYPPYLQSQSTTPSPQETLPSSMPMQMPFSGISQPSSSPYGYGIPPRTAQAQPQPQPQPQPQQLPQHVKATFGGQPVDGYPTGPHTYMMYESDAARVQQHPTQPPPHFQQAGFHPNPQQASSSNIMVRPNPQFMRSHPYNELTDKLVSMGYRGDLVLSAIQRLEESGQPVDFNAVLDRLNVHSSGGSQRGWSG